MGKEEAVNDLLALARLGDGDAFAELFQQQAQMLWKTAVSVMGSENEAADMLQETAIKAWMSVPEFDGKSKLSTWLTRILLNLCFDELRARKKAVSYGEVPCEAAIGGEPFMMHSSDEDDPQSRCEKMDVDSAMKRLGESDRLILTLFYVNDTSIADIASILGISKGAVRTRLTRARARFKQIYAKEENAGISLGKAALTGAVV